jgi:transposase-like protein
MQILHPFSGSVQQYVEALSDPDLHRPSHCPQCHAKNPLHAHGCYTRTIMDAAYDGIIRVRRYLCQACKRTVSLLPEFALPYLRSSIAVIALFLLTRLLQAQTLAAAAKLTNTAMPYQRGQFWIRRFGQQAEQLCTSLTTLTKPLPAPDFVQRALAMLEATGWISAHRFLFSGLRRHLLGWPRSLAPDGRRATLSPSGALT